MFKKIDHVEIVPTDINRTIEFYVSVLGFKLKERYPVPMPPMREIAFLELGGSVIELISAENPAAQRKQWETGYRAIAIEVENMAAAVDYLKGKGVPATWGPMVIGNSVRAEIQDPDGLLIELRQWGV